MGISLNELKKEISRAGTNKGKIVMLKEGSRIRVRFLTDFEDGTAIVFHDSYEKSVNVPCQEQYGRDCPYCDDDDLRTRKLYSWSVYDHESKEVKILLYAANNCSPVASLAAFYESYGTLLDRDYEIKRVGKGTGTTYSVIPQDKSKFRNTKVKALSEEAIMKVIDKAYQCEGSEDDEEEEEKETNVKSMNEPEDSEDWGDEKEEYENMKPQQLYKLCVEKGIECRKKMSKQYYIDLLEDSDDWGDE